MSFTVMRYKNGVPEPIKMSIWDAFKGAPPPKPRSKLVSRAQPTVEHSPPAKNVPAASEGSASDSPRCPCCHKVHSESKSSRAGESERAGRDDDATKDDSAKIKNPANDATTKDSVETPKQNVAANEDTEGRKPKDDKSRYYKENGKAEDNIPDHSRSTKDEETYSKQDNKKMIAMKAEGKTWAEILEALGKKSTSQAKAHWKTIDPSKQGDKDDKQHDEEAAKGDADTAPAGKKDDKQGKQKGKQDGGGGGKKSAGAKGKKDKQTGANTGVGGSNGDVLKGWADRYDRHKWIAAASRHFDLTGQRITPAIAKKLAEGK